MSALTQEELEELLQVVIKQRSLGERSFRGVVGPAPMLSDSGKIAVLATDKST